jgi:hypothetical protein
MAQFWQMPISADLGTRFGLSLPKRAVFLPLSTQVTPSWANNICLSMGFGVPIRGPLETETKALTRTLMDIVRYLMQHQVVKSRKGASAASELLLIRQSRFPLNVSLLFVGV